MNSDFSKYKKTMEKNMPMSEGDIVQNSNNLINEKTETKMKTNVQSNVNENNTVFKLTSERNKK